ncbi:CHAT domain-containing protein [Lactarius quietus]|nr:CHAT domain-containing protein [Lactarius quietus]
MRRRFPRTSELVKVVEVMSQFRAKARFEVFKKGFARNDMIKEIQECDRQITRVFNCFPATVTMDFQLQQLVSERVQSTPIPMHMPTPIPSVSFEEPQHLTFPLPEIHEPVAPTPRRMSIPTSSVTIEEPQPTLPYPLSFQQPRKHESIAQTSSLRARLKEAGSGMPVLFPSPLTIRPQVFLGRDGELKIMIDLIFSSTSLARIAILGPGGVGKTVLAHAVLTHEKVVSRFGDSRYFVQCESLTSRDALLIALANLFSLPGTTSVGVEPRVLSALGSEECILCLDNFESLWDQPDPSKKAVEMLLAHITSLSSVTVLVAMRGAERPKETAWTWPMLPPLTNFPRDAAKRTWESLAGTCDEWAEKLIDAVDCLPLAVTLLCGLARVSTAETLWGHWQRENIALLAKDKGDKLASLEFSIGLSLDSVRMDTDGSSKRLLSILSLMPDGMPTFPSPEFRRLFPDIPDISRSLDTLLKCSLAVRTEDRVNHVSPMVRLYCERNHLASPEDRRALRDYYSTLGSHDYGNTNHELSEITPTPQIFDTPQTIPLLSEGDGQSPHLSDHSPLQKLLEVRKKSLIAHIPSLPGFENFLTPPSFDVLSSAAAQGPVIIVNQFPSSVVVLLKDSPPSLISTPSNFHERASQLKDGLLSVRQEKGIDSMEYDLTLASVLADLYELVGKPVIEKLRQLEVPEKSRVWWCPTSAFCSLPLHALGPIPSDDGSELYFLDLYITSYTPTLSALIESRKPRSLSKMLDKPSLLLVAHSKNQFGAREEIRVVQTIATTVTTLASATATPTTVVEHLRDHQFAHFVCHSLLEAGKPFEASFKLHGNNLSLLDIVRSQLPTAGFAFLSARHIEPTEDYVANSEEGLHLVAAMQYCGFRSVVGTLWAIADMDGADLSKDFYKMIFSESVSQIGVPYYEKSARHFSSP